MQSPIWLCPSSQQWLHIWLGHICYRRKWRPHHSQSRQRLQSSKWQQRGNNWKLVIWKLMIDLSILQGAERIILLPGCCILLVGRASLPCVWVVWWGVVQEMQVDLSGGNNGAMKHLCHAQKRTILWLPTHLVRIYSLCFDLQVTKRVNDGGGTYGGWQSWNWNSAGDVFLNGAYFVNSGAQEQTTSVYAQAISVAPLSGQRTPAITAAAGPLNWWSISEMGGGASLSLFYQDVCTSKVSFPESPAEAAPKKNVSQLVFVKKA